MKPLLVRRMAVTDAAAVAGLSAQLGYPASADVIIERLASETEVQVSGQFVAEQSGTVLGWCEVYGVRLLASPVFYAEIGGLVVDAGSRRLGIGRALVAEAETWAKTHGYAEVRLRSGLHRTDAHEFYKSIGYGLAKTSHMFRKALV